MDKSSKPDLEQHYESSDIETASVEEKTTGKTSHVVSWSKRLLTTVETRGIHRVTDEERRENTTSVWHACTFWASANFAVATLNTGSLGGVMGLSFWDSFAIIMVVNILACLIPAWTAGFGLTGLRMTTFSRYSFGYWGNILVVIFSMVSTTGWNVINSISGASVLDALSNGKCPTWAGVIIITTTVWIICVLGLSWIHKLDTYLWFFPFLCWCVAAGTGAKHFSGHAVKSPTGSSGAASALSFVAVVFSFAVSWINCSADFNVRMPLKTPRWKLFVSTYIGIAVPTILVQTLGVAIYSGAQANPAWKHAFVEYGIGGPLQKALEPAGGFGKLCLVFAALSSVANNIPNNYAFANHAQNAGPWAIKVPRIAFVTLGYIAAIIVGCFAAKYFEDTLQTFLSVIGYWTIIHLVVVVEEHVIFRRARYGLYDWDAWDKPELLPFGWGAIGGFAFGFLGAALGMKTAWYVAPIAKLVGPKGANLGHEFTFAFSAVAFPAFRWLEKKYGGK